MSLNHDRLNQLMLALRRGDSSELEFDAADIIQDLIAHIAALQQRVDIAESENKQIKRAAEELIAILG